MDMWVACGAIILKDGKILMIQEAEESVRGLWNTPAGRLDPPETIVDAAVREIKEETGLDVEIDGLIGAYQRVSSDKKHFLLRFQFKASVVSGKLKFPKNEIMDAQWFTPEEILAMDDAKLRSPVIKASVRDYLAGKLYPVDAIKYLK